MENSVRAGATAVVVAIEEDTQNDRLSIRVEDNGKGLDIAPEQATDPFYTTKKGKRVGLGLALLKGAAERAGGALTVSRSELGGVSIVAEMQLSHVDRNPLGDVAASLSSVVGTNPGMDIWFYVSVDDKERLIRTSELEVDPTGKKLSGLAVARRFAEEIRAALEHTGSTA